MLDHEDMMQGLARVAQRAELLDITTRVYTARLAAKEFSGHKVDGLVDLTSIVLEARDIIAAVDGSIEADGLPGEEYEDDDEEEEEQDYDEAWLAAEIEREEAEWVDCTETAGCAMRSGHNGGCFNPRASLNGGGESSPLPQQRNMFTKHKDLW